MKNFFKIIFFLFFISYQLFAKPIPTFYGVLEVNEPVLLELIASKPVQRLKHIHQYGISYYTSHQEEYNRYDHSLGVFALLRIKGAGLEEQISGLLHDVSHTVFSHVGDYIFRPERHQDVYQDDIHAWFLQEYGIAKILAKHGLTITDILHKSGKFNALEQPLPNLCADRIEYNLQGAYYRGFLTKDEIFEIVEDLTFDGQRWISSKPELMKKMVEFSLHMTKECWGSPENYLMSMWFSEVIHRAIALGKLTKNDIHFGLDHKVWKKIHKISDEYIKERFQKIFHVRDFYTLVESSKADVQPKMKFRGVDPWIKQGKEIIRLTELDQNLGQHFRKIKEEMSAGWPIQWKTSSYP